MLVQGLLTGTDDFTQTGKLMPAPNDVVWNEVHVCPPAPQLAEHFDQTRQFPIPHVGNASLIVSGARIINVITEITLTMTND
jgi:hypothetical protein